MGQYVFFPDSPIETPPHLSILSIVFLLSLLLCLFSITLPSPNPAYSTLPFFLTLSRSSLTIVPLFPASPALFLLHHSCPSTIFSPLTPHACPWPCPLFSIMAVPSLDDEQKEEFDELVAEIKKLKGVVLRQEKKMETLESRIKEFDSLIKDATTFKLG